MKTHHILSAVSAFAFAGCLSGGSVAPDPNVPPAKFSGPVALSGDWGEKSDPNILYFEGSLDTLSFQGDSVRVQSLSWSDLGDGSPVCAYYKGLYKVTDGVLSLDLTVSDSGYASLGAVKLKRDLIVQSFDDKNKQLVLWEKNKSRNFKKFNGGTWK